MKTTKLLLFVTFVLAAGSAYCCGDKDCCGKGEAVQTGPSVEATKPVVTTVAEKEESEQEVEVAPEPKVVLAKNEARELVTEDDESGEEEVEEFDFKEFSKFAQTLKAKGSNKKNT